MLKKIYSERSTLICTSAAACIHAERNKSLWERPGKQITHTGAEIKSARERVAHFQICGSKFINLYIGKARAMKNGHRERCKPHDSIMGSSAINLAALESHTHTFENGAAQRQKESRSTYTSGSSTFSACPINPANFIVNPTKSALPLLRSSVSHARLSLPELLFSAPGLARALYVLAACVRAYIFPDR